MRIIKSVFVFPCGVLLIIALGGCRTTERLSMIDREGWPRVLEAPYAENGVVVDGILEEWKAALPVFYVDDVADPQRNSARTWAMWDEKYFYVAFSVSDEFLRATHTGHDNAFPDDGVEVLIDTRCTRSDDWRTDDYRWHINILDAIMDDRGTFEGEVDKSWNGNAFSKTTISGTINDEVPDEGYITEIAIPWKDIGLSGIGEGTELAVDFCVNDFDEDPEEYLYFDWCNLELFHKPSGFGLVRLVRGTEIPAKKPRSQRLIW
ncbi:MAG: sugar-binding protein [bacterium]